MDNKTISCSHENDCISRQQAINAIKDLCEECDADHCGECRIDYPAKDAKSVLEALPSFSCSHENDTISRQAALDVINHELRCGAVIDQCGLETAHDLIEDLPPAEPEIIRCKDCKHAHITYGGEVKYCDIWFPNESHYIDTDNYCSFAKRRTEVTT